jgi:hypothetical protein
VEWNRFTVENANRAIRAAWEVGYFDALAGDWTYYSMTRRTCELLGVQSEDFGMYTLVDVCVSTIVNREVSGSSLPLPYILYKTRRW